MADLEYSVTLGGFVPFGTTGTATSIVPVVAGDALFVRETVALTLTTNLPAASLTIGGLAGQSPVVTLPEGAVLAANVTVADFGLFRLGQNLANPNPNNPARLNGDLAVASGGKVLVVDGAMSGAVTPVGTIEIRNNATITPTGHLVLATLDQPLPVLVDATGTISLAGAADTATLLALLTNQDKLFNPLFSGHMVFSGTLDNAGALLPLASLGALKLQAATVIGGTINGGTSLAGCVLDGVAIAGTMTTGVGATNTITGSIGGFGTLAVDGALTLVGSVTLDPATIALGANASLTAPGVIDLTLGLDGALVFNGPASVAFGVGSSVTVSGTLDLGANVDPTLISWSSPGGSLVILPSGAMRIGAQTSFRLDAGFTAGITLTLDGGTLDLVHAATIDAVAFAGTGAALILGVVGGTTKLLDFADGVSLRFAGAADIGASTVLHDGTLDIFNSSSTLDGSFVLVRSDGGSYAPGDFNLGISGDALELTTTGIAITAACYAAGTRIETADGPRAVEALTPGMRVRTAAGELRDIIWIGHRRLDLRRHPRPWDVHPVRVRANAFGPGLPQRDLILSPDHAVHVEAVLIPVRYLLNGATVVQEPRPHITYHHVELASHDVILAEGLPAETYLDTGNRAAFENGAGPVALHPHFARTIWHDAGCAPLVTSGDTLALVRATLDAQAIALGYRRVETPELAATPTPTGTLLSSRSFIPAQTLPASADHRRLGVAVTAIHIDGQPAPLDDPRLGAGWHAPEPGLRWTNGDAHAAARTIAVETLDIGAVYWVAPNVEARKKALLF